MRHPWSEVFPSVNEKICFLASQTFYTCVAKKKERLHNGLFLAFCFECCFLTSKTNFDKILLCSLNSTNSLYSLHKPTRLHLSDHHNRMRNIATKIVATLGPAEKEKGCYNHTVGREVTLLMKFQAWLQSWRKKEWASFAWTSAMARMKSIPNSCQKLKLLQRRHLLPFFAICRYCPACLWKVVDYPLKKFSQGAEI